MIIKKVEVELTKEEIDSTEHIEIILIVKSKEDPEDTITYTINYPKTIK